jgi:hypothetical protein
MFEVPRERAQFMLPRLRPMPLAQRCDASAMLHAADMPRRAASSLPILPPRALPARVAAPRCFDAAPNQHGRPRARRKFTTPAAHAAMFSQILHAPPFSPYHAATTPSPARAAKHMPR